MKSLTVQSYLKRKTELAIPIPTAREFCFACRKSLRTCYCKKLTPFKSWPQIVILMHPLEAKHPVGTGRMAHRSLENSLLFQGIDFTNHRELNAVIANPQNKCMVLFPGPESKDLRALKAAESTELFSGDKMPVVIVIDGTWDLAQKILFRSKNLHALTQLKFQPRTLSRFRVRKQPHPACLSTIEAIYEVLTLVPKLDKDSGDPPLSNLGDDPSAPPPLDSGRALPAPLPLDSGRALPVPPPLVAKSPGPEALISVFDYMVETQLELRQTGHSRHYINALVRSQKSLEA